MASDKAFGNLSERVVSDINELRVGDVIHFDTTSHWVIVTELGDEYYRSASGSVNGVVTWTGRGKYETVGSLVEEGQATIYTRYPQ